MSGLKILMICSEAMPFAKAGGLGDAVSALSLGLKRLGHDVRLLLPRYGFIDIATLEPLPEPLGVPLATQQLWTAVHRGELPNNRGGDGITVYFLDHRRLFDRAGIYGTPEQPDFHDNPQRYALLCRAAFQLCRALHWIPDILHAHDWPAALVPVYNRLLEADSEFSSSATVLSIHNIGYQGIADSSHLPPLGVPADRIAESGLLYGNRINLLKGGISCADALVTVSPQHAREITTPEHGFGLDALLRARHARLTGIINGTDDSIWDPQSDPLLAHNYGPDDLSNKVRAKRTLQLEMGLAPLEDVPLIGMVSRLVAQKGFHELCDQRRGILPQILEVLPLQLAIMGSGDPQFEQRLRDLARSYPNLGLKIGYREQLAHQLQAGSDFFLMPSRYEPCGLNQMYALRYGTIPIVSRTGGLADTVDEFDPVSDSGNGFFINYPSPWLIFDAVSRAVRLWHSDPAAIVRMRRRAMQRRFPLSDTASAYVSVYRQALSD